MICKNCDNNFEGDFCNNCGQKASVQKVNFNYFINEISNSFFQVNRGIFYTLKELSVRPGKSIRDYLKGKRKPHYKPLAFALVTSTIFVLLSYLIGEKTFLGEALSGLSDGFKENENSSDIQNGFNWLLNNITYLLLLLVPFFSFSSYLIFKKSKYNYFEHLILNFYIAGLQSVIYLFFSLFFFLFNIKNYYIEILPIIISILYLFWTYIKFFNNKKAFLTILLTLLTYILYLLIFFLIINGLLFIYL